MKKPLAILATESSIEKTILEYLSLIGLAVKINRGGRAIKSGDGLKLIPFHKNIYCNRNVNYHPLITFKEHKEIKPPDILFIREGITFFFEVKSFLELKKISTWNQERSLLNRFKKYSYQRLRRQHEFIATAIKHGCFGGFVSDVTHVQEILETKPFHVWLP